MMKAPKLLHIVPRIPPAVCGIADHSALLASQLSTHENVVLGVGISNQSGQVVSQSRVEFDKVPSAALGSYLSTWKGDIVLHYVGYGYHTRGCPIWLLQNLSTWNRRNYGRLVTMFHEIYASGRPWSSSFWLQWVQRYIADQLARRSYAVLGSTPWGVAWLGRRSKNAHLAPVFSNIGENTCVPWQDREPNLVVFGAGWYSGSGDDQRVCIDYWCKKLGVAKVYWIGNPREELKLAHTPCIFLGNRSAEEASAYMQNSQFGYLDYAYGCLGKSSVFASYCAHGLVPLSRKDHYSPEERLVCGQHGYAFLSPHSEVSSNLSSVSKNASQWYAMHNLGATADLYKRILR